MFDRKQEKRLLAQAKVRKEAFQHAELERIDEENRLLKQQSEVDFAYQQAQLEKIQNAGFFYRMLYRIFSLVGKVLSVFNNSVGAIATILPPVNAVIVGFLTILELIEITFMSKEAMNSRVIKATNSFLSMGFSVASLVLAFNPATAPIAVTLLAGSIGVSLVSEGYFWYGANQALKLEKNKKVPLKKEIDHAIHECLQSNHQEDILTIKTLNADIAHLQNHNTIKSATKIAALKNQKKVLIQKIDLSVNQNSTVLSLRQAMQGLNKTILLKQDKRNELRRSFFGTLVSFMGMGLLAISSVLVAAAIVSNPIGLSLAGVALLGIVTTVALKDKFFPIKSTAQVVPENALPPQQIYHPHISDTEVIVNKLALGSSIIKKKILEDDVNFYKALDPAADQFDKKNIKTANDDAYIHDALLSSKKTSEKEDEEDKKSLPR